ncbi:MAG TPA: methyltransferase domain-containing protein [Bryobacteraceae bacterium]|nr:methyltransferase domain-containing protein [Bryobacteraceae bacterium]
MRKRVSGFALVLCAYVLCGQVAKDANERYQTKEGRESLAKTLSAADRDQKQKPKELVAAMSLQPGMTVADIGTGTGFMLPYLSPAVGSGGSVLSEDIFSDFLEKAQNTAKEHKLTNVRFIKGSETDPGLPENAVDVVLALDTYHHWNYPEKMLAALHRELRPGGRLVVVDYYKRPDAMPGGGAMQHIRLDDGDVIKEIQANHFRLISEHEHTKGSQYMAIFEKN